MNLFGASVLVRRDQQPRSVLVGLSFLPCFQIRIATADVAIEGMAELVSEDAAFAPASQPGSQDDSSRFIVIVPRAAPEGATLDDCHAEGRCH
ncbi:hypothetical protein BO226_19440 [Rhodococcus sp. 2G]|nr:hypothetical protein BO226_19110 [Rhodococcus sp. 2G]APE11104.1 hypothetical protein BO226_19440 [Rhodococcus sp. 2G]